MFLTRTENDKIMDTCMKQPNENLFHGKDRD